MHLVHETVERQPAVLQQTQKRQRVVAGRPPSRRGLAVGTGVRVRAHERHSPAVHLAVVVDGKIRTKTNNAGGILGGVFGAVCGVVYLWVAAKILVVLIAWAMGSGLSAFSFLEGFDVENTFVLKLFSNFNPLRLLFTL